MTVLATAEDWQAFATEARSINARNGWGLDFAFTEIPGYLALIHSEITEAWTALLVDDCIGELADVVVRCVDLAELLDPGTIGSAIAAVGWTSISGREAQSIQLMQLHRLTSDLLEIYRKVKDETACRLRLRSGLAVLVAETCAVAARQRLEQMATFTSEQWADPAVLKPAEAFEVQLSATLDKNRARTYRHGGLRT